MEHPKVLLGSKRRKDVPQQQGFQGGFMSKSRAAMFTHDILVGGGSPYLGQKLEVKTKGSLCVSPGDLSCSQFVSST